MIKQSRISYLEVSYQFLSKLNAPESEVKFGAAGNKEVLYIEGESVLETAHTPGTYTYFIKDKRRE